jgi:antitoxin (DNA-binding transcriptional repressor) of toxin-antitoxin stability system
MSLTISLEQASTQLSGLVRALGPNDVIVLTDNDKPVARIVPDHKSPIQRQAGKWKGILEIVDEGEDEILDIFKDYMP